MLPNTEPPNTRLGVDAVPSESLEGDREVVTWVELSSLAGSDLVREFASHCVAEHVLH